jgi:hypothetical protein
VADHGIGLGAMPDALAVDRPTSVARATWWLDDALAGIWASQSPEYAWQAGPLTGDGYPV